MGSARNNTLLAKLAFADPDRKDPMHDAACAYVAANAAVLYRRLISPKSATPQYDHDCDYYSLSRPGHPAYSARSEQEVLIGKGEGAYRTTIGFADVVVTGLRFVPGVFSLDPRKDPELCSVVEANGLFSVCNQYWACSVLRDCGAKLAVEVKWSETSISDAIRQVSVYQDYTPHWIWCIAAPWPINAEQKRALDSRRLRFVRLDREKVVAFANQQRATEAPAEVYL